MAQGLRHDYETQLETFLLHASPILSPPLSPVFSLLSLSKADCQLPEFRRGSKGTLMLHCLLIVYQIKKVPYLSLKMWL